MHHTLADGGRDEFIRAHAAANLDYGPRGRKGGRAFNSDDSDDSDPIRLGFPRYAGQVTGVRSPSFQLPSKAFAPGP